MTAVVLAAGLAALGYRDAIQVPEIRRVTIALPDYPADAAPLRVALFSDVHVHGPDMPPQRLERIVDRINGLHPDVIIAAGDYIGDNWFGREYPIGEAIAPLRRLKSRLGVYAVLGNNDYDVPAETVATDLRAAGITILVNGAVSAGPLAIGGIDGAILPKHASWWARRNWTYSALRRTPGIKVLVAHRPDEFQAAPAWVSIVLAGHTHCGQIVLPLIGALETGSDYGSRYRCGVYRDGAKTLVVTGGLGTSHVPLRIGAPPDIWLITIRRSPAPAR